MRRPAEALRDLAGSNLVVELRLNDWGRPCVYQPIYLEPYLDDPRFGLDFIAELEIRGVQDVGVGL